MLGTGAPCANAVISELIPTAALLTIRRRRRAGRPVGYPTFLLVCAAGLSLAAQLAVAKPGLSGWLLSAVPALAFLGLSKLVLAGAPERPAEVVAADPVRAEPEVATSDEETVPPVFLADQPRPRLVPVPASAFVTRTREANL